MGGGGENGEGLGFKKEMCEWKGLPGCWRDGEDTRGAGAAVKRIYSLQHSPWV